MDQPLTLNSQKTTVLAMDYQKRQLSLFTPAFQKEIIARASRVLDKVRQAAIPLIHVQVQRGDSSAENPVLPMMTPRPGEIFLTKSRTGPFSTTNLDEILKKSGTETLVIMGVRTSGCVLTAVRWAADIDYKLVVLSDCCADAEADVHQILMGKVFPRQASVITSQDFLKILDRGRQP